MKCTVNTAIGIAALIFSALTVGDAAAVQITLNLVPVDSHVTIETAFSGAPDDPQDVPAPLAGTTDYDPLFPSNRTTFSGTITVDVDNVLAPTSIKILSSTADAALTGAWFPQPRTLQDLNGNGDEGEFGLPPDGDSEAATNTNFRPAADADWGMRFFNAGIGGNFAYGAYRDIAYNVTSGTEAVDGLGQFSSVTEHFEPDGFLDYWIVPGAGGLLGRTEANTGEGDHYENLPTAGLSSYIATPLGGGASLLTLRLPVHVDDMGEVLRSVYTGQFVATLVIPEPTTLVLFGTALAAAFAVRRRK